ncbi:MAG TPA: hypothetical protein VJT75_08300 [Thermoleophilaceae bacterium]|nr:hypothetical protein [Thermoleophilaceae bacterium]
MSRIGADGARGQRKVLRLACVLTIAAAGIGLVAGLSTASDSSEQPSSSVASVLDDPEIQAAAQRSLDDRQQEEAARETQAARADRAESRDAYRDLSASEALAAVTEELPEVVTEPVFKPIEPDDGARVEHYDNNDTSAVVETAGGDRVLAESNLPLRGTTVDGDRAPIDLTLEAHGDRYSPESAPLRASLPAELSAAAELPSTGGTITVRAVGADVAAARADDDKLLYPNAQTDADVLAASLPTGVELSNIVRSPDAPETFAYEFGGLPAGAQLRLAGGGHAAEIVDGDQRLVSVHPPTAMAADGQPLPVTLSVAGDRLELSLLHRGRDVAYPLAIDPVIETFNWNAAPSTDFNGWTYSFAPGAGSLPGHASGLTDQKTSTFGAGLFVKTNGVYLYNQDDGIYRFSAPGDAYVYRADFNLQNWNNSTTGGSMCTNAGIFAPSRAAADSTFYVNCGNITNTPWGVCVSGTHPNCATTAGTGGNVAQTDFWAYNGGQRPAFNGWDQGAESYIRSATVYVNDRFAPTFSWAQGVQPPTAWTNGSGSYTLNAKDGGLGLKTASLSTSVGGWTGPSVSTGCTGSRFDRVVAPGALKPKCDIDDHGLPFSLGTLPEGSQTLNAAATDALGTPGSLTYPLKLDRTDPVADTSGELRFAEDEPRLSTDSPSLHVFAADDEGAASSSGVKRIEVKLDGVDTAPSTNLYERQAACDGCSLEHDFTLNTSSLAPGVHTVDVLTTDFAGNTDDQTWDFKIDRASAKPPCADPDADPEVCLATTPPASNPGCATATPLAQSSSGTFVSSAQAIQTTQQQLPAALAAPDTVGLENLSIAPTVPSMPVGAAFPSASALAPAGLGSTAATYTVGSGASAMCVAPVTKITGAPPPAVVDGKAIVYADTAASTDTILRPSPLGVTQMTQIRDTAAPDSFSYQVGLQGTQYLKQLDTGAVAVIDPTIPSISSTQPAVNLGSDTSPATAEPTDEAPEPTDESTDPWTQPDSEFADLRPSDAALPPNATENSYDSERDWLQYSDQDADGQAIAIITPPEATDAAGLPVTTDLSVSGSTVTATVSHHAGAYSYPVIAKSKGVSSWPPKARRKEPDVFIIDGEGPADLKTHNSTASEGIGRIRTFLRGAHRGRFIIYAGVCDDFAGNENYQTGATTMGDARNINLANYTEGTPEFKRARQCKRAVDFIQSAQHVEIDPSNITISVSPRLDQVSLPQKAANEVTWARSIRRLWLTQPFDQVKNWGPANEPNDSKSTTTADPKLAARMWRQVDRLAHGKPKNSSAARCAHCQVLAGEFSEDVPVAGKPNYVEQYMSYLDNGAYARPKIWAIHAHSDLYFRMPQSDPCFVRVNRPRCDERQFRSTLRFIGRVKRHFGERRSIWVNEAGVTLYRSEEDAGTPLAGHADLQRHAAREFLRLADLEMVKRVGLYRFFGHDKGHGWDSALVTPAHDPVLVNGSTVPDLESSRKFRPAYCVLTGRPDNDLCKHTAGE